MLCVFFNCAASASELEVSLLVLPFHYVPELLTLFNSYIQQGLEVELVCRCLFFLLKYVVLLSTGSGGDLRGIQRCLFVVLVLKPVSRNGDRVV